MLAAIGSWLLGGLLKLASGNVLGRVVEALAKSDAGQAKLEEIRGRVAERLSEDDRARARDHAAAANARQAAKFNQPVFWVLIAVMMGPPALLLWSVGLYNIFWWSHGIWPQGWSIADFPPSIKPWVEQSITWLYDPLGAPSTVGAAAAASWLTATGRR